MGRWGTRMISDVSPGTDNPELFLIDGNSMAYRAFFALPDSMATADGRPTNAIFGLASMMVKLISDYRPRQIVVAWDAGMSGREVIYAEYKAQRPPKPDLLRAQWPHLVELVDAFGYTNIKVDGYEADDVIASLVAEARRKSITTVVVTGDRDAYQLVGDGVTVMSTARGVTDTKIYDEEAVKERYGVYPNRVTDLMGLRGDTSDNIPGVPGIGEKTAAALLEQFDTLEDVLANVDQISGKKRKENLTEFAEDARISKVLATMKYDIETGIDRDEVMNQVPDRAGLRDFMMDFELRAALGRLEEALGEDESIPGESEAAPEPTEVELSEGTVADLADGPIAVEMYGGGAATDGSRVVGGDGGNEEFAEAIAGKPLVAHDIKAVGGRTGLGERGDRAGPDDGASQCPTTMGEERCVGPVGEQSLGGEDARRLVGPQAVAGALGERAELAISDPTIDRVPHDEVAHPAAVGAQGVVPEGFGRLAAPQQVRRDQAPALQLPGMHAGATDEHLAGVGTLAVGVHLVLHRGEGPPDRARDAGVQVHAGLA